VKTVWLTVIVGFALVLGVWTRTHGADQRWVWRDEVTTLLHVMGHVGSDVDGSAPRTFGDLAAYVREPAPGGPNAVVSALVREDAQHPPLYYVGQRVWNDAGGGALGRRSFSIVLGMCAVAAIGWFGYVLGGPRAGAFSVALSAVSPFLVLYGEQMREYGLWCALIALSSGALVVATRRGTLAAWAGYAAAGAAALWTSPLSLLLAPAHLAYAAFAGGWRKLVQCALAYAAALVAFGPWLWVMFAHRTQIVQSNAWSATPYSFLALTAKVLFTTASAFTDLAYANRFGIVAGGLVLLAIAAATIALVRRDREAAVLLGSIAVTTTVLPFVADVLTGQHRTASSRYLCPLVVVTVVAMGCALARISPRRGAAAAAVLVVLAAVSSAIGTSSRVWWDNHGDSSVIEIGAVLAHGATAPVLYEGPCSGLLGLARLVPAAEPVRCGPNATATLAAGSYVFSPSAALTARARSAGLSVVTVAGGHDVDEAVRAFRQRQRVADDEPTLAKLERSPRATQ
jgi:uncharacterized membrane protein